MQNLATEKILFSHLPSTRCQKEAEEKEKDKRLENTAKDNEPSRIKTLRFCSTNQTSQGLGQD
jgi:hypothetical protein